MNARGRIKLGIQNAARRTELMWTKICGLKDAETALVATDAGASAIGLNFFAQSPRYVDPQQAAVIAKAVSGKVQCVGLFVNEPVDSVVSIAEAVGLDGIQLHGAESPEYLHELTGQLPGRLFIRAFNVDKSGLDVIARYVSACEMLSCRPWACLVDARVVGEHGGTGQTAPWDTIEADYREDWPPLILAGGLNAANVAAAVAATEPWGIDVASGVERERGAKDPELIRDFLAVSRNL